MVIYCIEYVFNGKTKYTEIIAKSKHEAIKILLQKTDLPEFEYTMWTKKEKPEYGKK